MKTTEILTLGAIVAGIFVLGKRTGVAGVGRTGDYITVETEFGVYQVPTGTSKKDKNKRVKIIKHFYHSWRKQNPKGIFNSALNDFIKATSLSKSETSWHASERFESTLAVFNLTEILEKSILVEEYYPKGNRSQSVFDKIYEMRYRHVKLMVGRMRHDSTKVQYSITAIEA